MLDRICEEDHCKKLSEFVDIALKKEALILQTKTVAVHTKERVRHMKAENKVIRDKRRVKRKRVMHAMKVIIILKCVPKYRKYKCKICNKIGHLAKVQQQG